MITQARLKELVHYNPETGVFTNLVQRNYNAPVGKRAGKVVSRGRYRVIALDGLDFYEHHLAWFYVYGVWPTYTIDHWDGNGTYNAIGNLREATQSENMCNAQRQVGSSGLKGAYLDERRLTWYSQIQLGGQSLYLGTFDSAEEANQAYLKAAEKYHGEFAFHNRPNPKSEAS